FEVLTGDEVDAVGEVGGRRRFAVVGAVDEEALADLYLVAGVEEYVTDGLVVDEGAVGAAEVEQAVAVGGAAQLGVAARDFGVGQGDAVGGAAAEVVGGVAQLELPAFVGTLGHDQARQSSPWLRLRSGGAKKHPHSDTVMTEAPACQGKAR